MSSTFSLICATHDPAIVLDGDYPDARRILEALAPGGSIARQHPSCDLIAGRWSGGLIELGCLPTGARPVQYHFGAHRDFRWVDAPWLRLLLLTTPEQRADAQIGSCWTYGRLATLHQVLKTAAAGPGEAHLEAPVPPIVVCANNRSPHSLTDECVQALLFGLKLSHEFGEKRAQEGGHDG